jgi:hypothetical protein
MVIPMKSFSRFLRRISSRLLLSPDRLRAIEALDPSHIYVENVRSLFGLSTSLAKRLCDLAVRQGFLEKRVEVLCPDAAVAAEAPSVEMLPAEVSCWQEVNGTFEQAPFPTSRLKKMEFYVLKEGSAA